MKQLKEFVDGVPDKNNIKIITCALMGHGVNMKQEAEGDWSVYWHLDIIVYNNDYMYMILWLSSIDLQDLIFRIKFSDGDFVRMLNFIHPILDSSKFRGIPKADFLNKAYTLISHNYELYIT